MNILIQRMRETGQIRTKFRGPGVETLNARELGAVDSLIAWVATEQDTAQDTVRRVTASRFGVRDLPRLPRNDYDAVIRFLVELQIDLESMNSQTVTGEP